VSKREYKLYLINIHNTSFYKIGISVNPGKRVKQLQTGTPQQLNIISIFNSKYPFKTEKSLHNKLNSKKVTDNFNYDFEYLKGEWFNLAPKDVLDFLPLCNSIENTIDNLKKAGNPFI